MGLLKHFSSTVLKEDTRSARLDALVSDAEKRVVDLSAAILNASSGSSSMSNTQQKVCSVIFKLFKTPLFKITSWRRFLIKVHIYEKLFKNTQDISVQSPKY